MKFDDLDKIMRTFETSHDYAVPKGTYMIARIDGRSFTRLTKEVHQFEAPFDVRFRDLMVETVKHLMSCGFTVPYGFTESDEISLLFATEETAFGRKMKKYNSILAGEASAKFSVLLKDVAAFDCRICQLPTEQRVVDYFRWRSEDAFRNSLNAYVYWTFRKAGKNARAATKQLEKLLTYQKKELLLAYNVDFDTLPKWQKRGIGLYWENYDKVGFNPKTNKETITQKRRIKVDYDLPERENYDEFIKGRVQ